jgi:uncharacterized protein YlaI
MSDRPCPHGVPLKDQCITCDTSDIVSDAKEYFGLTSNPVTTYIQPSCLTKTDMDVIRSIVREELERFLDAAVKAVKAVPDQKLCSSCGGVTIDKVCVDCGM